jgi:hypothetical protein
MWLSLPATPAENGFVTPLKALVEEGIIEYQKDSKVRLTEHGIDPPRDNAATQARLCMLAKKDSSTLKMNQLFDALIDGEKHEGCRGNGVNTHTSSKGFTEALKH